MVWTFAGVYTLMACEMRALTKSLRAVAASVWLLAGVHALMTAQSEASSEAFAAGVALERFLTGVNPLVGAKGETPSEGFTTDVAGKVGVGAGGWDWGNRSNPRLDVFVSRHPGRHGRKHLAVWVVD